ncbi:hypothetical protein PAESOLCIP111_05552 [Paenibacillus solanacearum]|uniref:Teneurin-like YD-shell domain-containing protein n=1 Tax=Paenibacillus solanacearum TaxID=2048548 RepID=A0A916NLF8_9BACL|nr:RHS repeat-associated core domain-containing protein [Paenibacillus solanacearum]CAG7648207.1 hypothetical protein PAESOLCIP111_05552 [Paenibacillus solanacearum]
MIKKCISLTLAWVLLFSMVTPVAGAADSPNMGDSRGGYDTAVSQAVYSAVAQNVYDRVTDNVYSSVTESVYGTIAGRINELSLMYNIDISVIRLKLLEGYELQDIEWALQLQQQNHKGLQELLDILRPKGLSPIPVGGGARRMSIASDNPYASEIDAAGVKAVNTNPDQAPFQVNSGREQISTLSGELTIKETDLTLPGRSGLSFALTRTYRSNSSGFFKEDTELVHPGTLKFQYNGYTYTQTMDSSGNVVSSPKTEKLETQNFSNATDFNEASDWIIANQGKDITYSNWTGPDANGVYTRTIQGVSSNAQYKILNQDVSSISYFRNKASEKPKEQKWFPIGAGWSWSLPFIDWETEGFSGYVYIGDGSSYKWAVGNRLSKYPFEDLYIGRTSASIVVNGETAGYELNNNVTKRTVYFTQDGRPIQISDAYGNTIQFEYKQVESYGKVLGTIRDAIGNTIDINYTATQVILTSNGKTVVYTKVLQDNIFPDQPWRNKKTDLLVSVQDVMGNTTRYAYLEGDTPSFNLTNNSGIAVPNKHAYVNTVEYPTGARTMYTYESVPIFRYYSENSFTRKYRLTSREDQVSMNGSTVAYNHQDYSYENDMATRPTYRFDTWGNRVIPNDVYFKTIINDGLKTTTVNNVRYYHNRLTDSGVFLDTEEFYYNLGSTVKSGDQQYDTTHTYDLGKDNPNPIETKTQYQDASGTSTPVIVKRTYDNYGNVLTQTDPNDITTRYTYDYGLLKTMTKPVNANLTHYAEYERNAQGSVTQLTVKDNNTTGPLRLKVNYNNYDAFGHPTSITVTDGQSSRTIDKEYNNAAPYRGGFLTKQAVLVTDVEGNRTPITQQFDYYTDTGLLKKLTDGKNYGTTYQYDAFGRVTTATFPDASQVNITYDDVSNMVTSRDETGVTTITKWNPIGLKLSTTIQGSGTIAYEYDNKSRQTAIIDALNHRTQMIYDNFDRPVETIAADGSRSKLAYNDVARTKTATDGENNKSVETYDKLGRVIRSELFNASNVSLTHSTFDYDYIGNAVQAIDGKAQRTKYTYDILGRLTSVEDAKNQKMNYSYNFADKLTQIQYPDLTVVLNQYDELGRLIQKTDQEGAIEKYFYDANNNLVTRIDRKNQTTLNTFNSRNRLTKSVVGSEIVEYDYDNAGRRTLLKDATGSTQYLYNTIGQLATVTFPDGKTMNYTYDLQGNRKQMTDPFHNVTVYDYDQKNRLSHLGPALNDWDAGYSYKNNNLLSSVSLRNGISSNYTYNGTNLAQLTYQRSGITLSPFQYNYTYDNNLNQTSKTENGAYFEFAYDELNRISTSSQFSEQYQYDARGNRSSLQTRNNLLDKNKPNYQYNARNELVHVSDANGANISYTYNGDGLLYERTENGQTTRYYYDGASVIAEGNVANGASSLKTRYVRGNGLVARVDANGTKSYYVHNGHGDVVGLTDGSGSILNQYTYDIWGNPLVAQEQIKQPFRYSGELWDSSTNLQYLRARWYDPSVGRFINQDTYEGDITNPLTLNLYTYVHNNPLRYSDPNGHWATEITANWTINEMKWQWEKAYSANNTDKMKYWAGEANKLRERMRTAGYSESDIMQSDDYSIPEAVVMDIAWASTINWIESDSLGLKLYVDAVQMIIPDPMALGTLKGPGGMKFSFSNLPKNPNELLKNGWKDVTPDGMLKNTTSREYHDEVTGFKVRFDPGKEGANGFEGMDHYHFYNPNSTGKMDYYIDKSGNPVPKGSKPSHIVP